MITLIDPSSPICTMLCFGHKAQGLYTQLFIKNNFFSVEDTNEDEGDNELDDFNEEEDYIKFLQKENMSPMIPKAKSNKLPLPVVTCEWTDKKSANNAPIYRPGLGIVPLYLREINFTKFFVKLIFTLNSIS